MSNEGLDLPEIDIDLSGDDIGAWGGGGGPRLPIGTYTFDIVSAKQDVSKKNQPVAKIMFKVADEGEQLGVELEKSYSLQTQSLGRIKNLMIACGARLDKIRLGELVGARIIAEIIHTVGAPVVDAQGETKPGGTFCDVVKETAIEQPVAAAAPPPATNVKAKAAAAPAPAAQPNKNGAVASRRT